MAVARGGAAFLLLVSALAACGDAAPGSPSDVSPPNAPPASVSSLTTLPTSAGPPGVTDQFPFGQIPEPPVVRGVQQLSADGTLLGIRVVVGCPFAEVGPATAAESAGMVDITVSWDQPTLSSADLQRTCSTQPARPEEVVAVRLGAPVADRAVRVNGEPVSWDPPAGTVGVMALLASEPAARPSNLPDELGVAFDTGVGCYVVWPWKPDAVLFPSPVPVGPGSQVQAWLTPMANPGGGVVESCDRGDGRPTVSLRIPEPPDPTARLERVDVVLRDGFVRSDGSIDPTAFDVSWQTT